MARELQCETCGKAMGEATKGMRRYCSEECRSKFPTLEGRRGTCQRCGKIFKPLGRNTGIYCSPTCYHEARAERIKATLDQKCEVCGKMFHRPHTKRSHPYCSRACFAIKRNKRVQKECSHCGKSYEVKACFEDTASYCSRACADDGRKKDPVRICRHCGKEYIPCNKSLRSKYCSGKCTGAAQKKRVKKTCLNCGKPYETIFCHSKTSKYCSKKCCTSHWKPLDSHWYPIGNLPRPRPYLERSYRIIVTKVKARDGQKCQQCGQQFHKGSRKIEAHHTIPLRFGGTDLMTNLVTLCKSCHGKVESDIRAGAHKAKLAGCHLDHEWLRRIVEVHASKWNAVNPSKIVLDWSGYQYVELDEPKPAKPTKDFRLTPPVKDPESPKPKLHQARFWPE